MARMNKETKARRNIERLSAAFNVPAPTVSIGSCGRMTWGLYRREGDYLTYPPVVQRGKNGGRLRGKSRPAR